MSLLLKQQKITALADGLFQLLVMLYFLVFYTSRLVENATRLLYILMIGSLLLVLVLRGFRLQKLPITCIGLFLVVIWGSVSGFFQEQIYLKWFVGDFAVLLFPVLLVLYFRGLSGEEISRRINRLFWLLLICSVWAAVAFSIWPIHDRYRAPPILILAMVLTMFVFATSRKSLVVGGLAAMLVFWLVVDSGQRTTLLFFPAILMVVVLALMVMKASNGGQSSRFIPSKAVILLTPALFFVLVFSFGEVNLTSIFAASNPRLLLLLNGPDVSTLARFYEVENVFGTIRDSWGLGNFMFGSGHGATFIPYNFENQPNINSDFRVHNIHVSIVMFFFRYGLFGLVVFLLLGFSLMGSFFNLFFKNRMARNLNPLAVSFSLAAPFYLVDSFLRNVFILADFQILIAFVIASSIQTLAKVDKLK